MENSVDGLSAWVGEVHDKVSEMQEFKKKCQTLLIQAENMLKKKELLLYFAKLLQMIDAKVLQM